MSLPPPRKKLPPPRKTDIPPGHIVLQPARSFDTEQEMESFLKVYHANMLRVHKTWKVEVIRCEIIIPTPKRSG
jgi:hypothetical protein